MDLKIKDVADLLNVSETTIRRWLSDGKIPAYRINHQYRFSRLEIEDWVMAQKLGHHIDTVSSVTGKTPVLEQGDEIQQKGRQQFSLYRALHKGGVIHDVQGNTKEDVIRSTMKMIAKNLSLDPEVITELLLERENLQPTSLNNGIGVPHTRECLIKAGKDAVTIVFPKHPIEYGALDKEPVNTLFFLFASDDKKHLHLLAKIAHLSSQPAVREMLRKKPEKEQLLDYVKEWESAG